MTSLIQQVIALISRKKVVKEIEPSNDYIHIGRKKDQGYTPEMQSYVIKVSDLLSGQTNNSNNDDSIIEVNERSLALNDALLLNANNKFTNVPLSVIIDQATLATQGYFALLSSFYFTPGIATETIIPVEDENTWIDVNFDIFDNGGGEGLFDFRPTAMKEANAVGFDEATGFFTLEGLNTNAFCSFRASMTFEPEEDEGELQARLFFERHSGTIPADPFPIEDVVATMSQGADIEYPVEPFLSFFVGDTIDTNAPGDAGKCKFQIKSSVAGIVRMRALTWYINK